MKGPPVSDGYPCQLSSRLRFLDANSTSFAITASSKMSHVFETRKGSNRREVSPLDKPKFNTRKQKIFTNAAQNAESILLPPIKIATSALKTVLAIDKASSTTVSTNFQATMTTRMLLISSLSKLSGDNTNYDKFFEVGESSTMANSCVRKASQSANGDIFQHTIINAMNTRCVPMRFDMHSHQFKEG